MACTTVGTGGKDVESLLLLITSEVSLIRLNQQQTNTLLCIRSTLFGSC